MSHSETSDDLVLRVIDVFTNRSLREAAERKIRVTREFMIEYAAEQESVIKREFGVSLSEALAKYSEIANAAHLMTEEDFENWRRELEIVGEQLQLEVHEAGLIEDFRERELIEIECDSTNIDVLRAALASIVREHDLKSEFLIFPIRNGLRAGTPISLKIRS
jgi:hypothetical protein